MLPKSLAGFLVLVSFLIGIFAASYVSFPWEFIFMVGTAGVAILLVGAIRRPGAITGGIAIIALTLGLARMEIAELPDVELSTVLGVERAFTGLIVESPEVRGQVLRITVKTTDLTDSSQKLLLITRKFPLYERGEAIQVVGTVASVDEEQIPESLRRQGIDAVVKFPKIETIEPRPFSLIWHLGRIRDAFRRSIQGSLPEPDAGFTLGIISGERSSISNELREAFNRTGTSHLVALSGFNITIIALFIGWMLGGLHPSPRMRLLISALVIALFVLLVEGGASVVRAAVMGILGLIARERARMYEMTNALVFAAAIMVFLNPYLLRFDLSFQLSFLATLGIIIAPHYIESFFSWLPRFFEVREIVIATISAELFVFPLILWHFGSVSFIGPVANLLVLPVIPLTMLAGFVVGLVGFWGGVLSQIVAWPLHLLITYELSVIQALSALPGSAVSFAPSFAWIFALPALSMSALYFYQRFARISYEA